MFGDARPQIGALILPSDAGAELANDPKAYLDAVWPVIAQANATAPSHSRILPEMVDILPVGTEIPVVRIFLPQCTSRSSLTRRLPRCRSFAPHATRSLRPLIDSIYERFEQGTGAPKKVLTTRKEMEEHIYQLLTNALSSKSSTEGLTPSTDLFEFGVDSLSATRVRNDLVKTLDLGDAKLGQNVVYEHPSISALATYLLGLRSGGAVGQDAAETHKAMWAMVDKWAQRIVPASTANSQTTTNGSRGEVIVLTGATGSLGAHILENLVNRPEVSKVICLSRASSHAESLARVQSSLAQRQRTLSSEASAKVVSLAADVNKPDLGLNPAELEMIRSEATAFVHNAWPVNFSLSLQSFEPHIGGAVNMLNIAQTSPKAVKPAFFFSSSVGTRQGRIDPIATEDFSDDPATAGGMGYGRSKWVVEKILERAAGVGGRTGVLRIGQLVGDTEK